MAMTVKAIAESVGRSPARVHQYIDKEGLKDELITTHRPYLVPDSIARQIIEHFSSLDNSDVTQEENTGTESAATGEVQATTTDSALIEVLTQQIDILNQQISVKDKRISDLMEQNYMLTKSLVQTNQALSISTTSNALVQAREQQPTTNDLVPVGFWNRLKFLFSR